MVHFSPFVQQVLVAAAIAVGFLGFGHYAPWRLWLQGRDLRQYEAYVYGTVCVLLPVTGATLICDWSGVHVAVASWIVAAAGGIAVIGMYAMDGSLRRAAREREEREVQRMRGETNGS